MKKCLVLATPPVAALAVLVFGMVAALALNWPGHLSYDSVLQLHQGRAGLYNDWHPPVMAWLLGLGDAIVPGAGLFVALDTIMAFGALICLVALKPAHVSWTSVAVAFVIVLSPQFLLYQGLVWKDVLFADSAVAGFACLAQAAARWAGFRVRVLWLTASLAFLSLAALARQNGVILLPFAAGALGWIATQNGMSGRKAALLATASLAAPLALILAASALLGLRSEGDSGPAGQLRLLQVYDLAGAVARQPDLPLEILADDDPALEHLIRTTGARLYTPIRNDPLAGSPDIAAALSDDESDTVGAQWRALIFDHPWLYLRVRAAAFIWVFATPDIVACRPIFTGIEGPEREMRNLGLKPRRDSRDRLLESYGKIFLGTPILSHLTFATLAAFSLVFLLRRRRSTDIAIAGLLLGAFAFALSFFVISIACDYRYLYALDLSALAALLYLGSDSANAHKGAP